jgi:hypothetical protein
MAEAKVRDPQDQEQQPETPKAPAARPPVRLRVNTDVTAGEAEVDSNGTWSN